MKPNCRIVHFKTCDGLQLDGILAYCGGNTTIIHVHGKCGNFYANDFISVMNKTYLKNGLNFLSFNNRGHDCLAETYKDNQVTYVGGSIERFEDCVKDIQAAVNFVEDFSERVILQGHSNGCEKVLYYNLNANLPLDSIFLSPSDSYELHAQYLDPETVDEQYQRLKRKTVPAQGWEWLDEDEYGISVQGKDYPIPITHQSLLDLHEGPGFKMLRYGGQWSAETIDCNLLACVGGEDPYSTVSPSELSKELEKRVENVEVLFVEGADHHFHEREEPLMREIIEWVSKMQ